MKNIKEIEKIISYKKTYINKIKIIILILSGTSHFLSCCQPLLTKPSDFTCYDKENNIIKCDSETICYNKDINRFIKNPSSIDNYSYKFDLYCNKKYFIGLFGTCYFFGAMIGSVLIAPLVDKYGRERIFKILIFLTLILNLNLIFVINPIHLTIIFLLVGTINYAKHLCNVLLSEFSYGKHVGFAISLSNSMFPILGITVGIYYKLFNNLIIILIIVNILVFFILILSFKYIIESPLWLISQKRYSDTYKSLKFIADINEYDINNSKEIFQEIFPIENDFNQNNNSYNKIINETNENINNKLDNKENEENIFKDNNNKNNEKLFYNYYDILCMKSIQKILYIMLFIGFSSSFSYYGLLLSLTSLKGDFYFNYFSNFIAETISLLLSGFISDKIGRKITLQIFSFIAGMIFIIYKILPEKIQEFSPYFVFVISFCINAAYNVQTILSNEIFNANIKGSCIGLINIIGNLASTIVPSLVNIISWSQFIFGAFLIVSALLITFIKEKNNEDKEEKKENLIEIQNKL